MCSIKDDLTHLLDIKNGDSFIFAVYFLHFMEHR